MGVQALWPLVSVLRSQQSARSRPARDILKIPEEKDFPWPSTKEFSFFQSACQQLIGNDNSSSTGRGLVAELMKLCNITLVSPGCCVSTLHLDRPHLTLK